MPPLPPISFANTPEPPYFMVIFSSQRTEGDHGYNDMAERMLSLATEMPGFLGIESARDDEGFGITVSYWKDEASIREWNEVGQHQEARRAGHKIWYSHFQYRIGRVDKAIVEL